MIPVKAFLQLPKDGPPIDAKTGGPATQAAYFTTLTDGGDRPLSVQLGGADPKEMLEVARLLQGQCDCIDVNCTRLPGFA